MLTEKNQDGGEDWQKLHRARLKVLTNEFNERILEMAKGCHKNTAPLRIGKPSKCLLDCGFPDLPIEVAVSRLTEKMNQPNHKFGFPAVVHMPDCICDPIAIFQSVETTPENVRKVVLTEMKDSVDVNIVVVIELNKKFGKTYANSIVSLYPKDSVKGIYEWMRPGMNLMEYCNKEKALNWLNNQQSIPADLIKLIEGFTNIAIQCSK